MCGCKCDVRAHAFDASCAHVCMHSHHSPAVSGGIGCGSPVPRPRCLRARVASRRRCTAENMSAGPAPPPGVASTSIHHAPSSRRGAEKALRAGRVARKAKQPSGCGLLLASDASGGSPTLPPRRLGGRGPQPHAPPRQLGGWWRHQGGWHASGGLPCAGTDYHCLPPSPRGWPPRSPPGPERPFPRTWGARGTTGTDSSEEWVGGRFCSLSPTRGRPRPGAKAQAGARRRRGEVSTRLQVLSAATH